MSTMPATNVRATKATGTRAKKESGKTTDPKQLSWGF